MSEYIITDKQLGLIQDFATVCVEGEKLQRIVRCRDCGFGAYDGEECRRIDEWDESFWFTVEPDGFCAWGERQEP